MPRSAGNTVTHRRYTTINFIPKFLFGQFRLFYNLFYLAISVAEFIPAFRISSEPTLYVPLLIVVFSSLIRELLDESKRWKRDRELNIAVYHTAESSPTSIPSEFIHVGDVIEVSAGQRVPADIILLHTSDPSGTVVIRTDQLNGEADCKLRHSLSFAQRLSSFESISFNIEQPRPSLSEFSGTASFSNYSYAISIDSMLWSESSIVRGSVVGVVAYVGHETRASLNACFPNQKISHFDNLVGKYSSVLFGVLFITSLISSILNGIRENFLILFNRFLLLFSLIVPISIRICLDISGLIFSYRLSSDSSMQGTLMQNSALTEELGCVQFLFADKTGTLTTNDFVFRKFQFNNSEVESSSILQYLCISLCNSAFISADVISNASPEEIALMKHCSEVGYKTISKSSTEVVMSFPDSTTEKFNIIGTVPFSNEYKYSAIIVKSGRFGSILICKGSDNSISKIGEPCDWLEDVVAGLSRDGLRTLVFAYKELSEKAVAEYESDLSSNDAFEKICKGLTIAGVAGIEDELQEGVTETIEALSSAGIRVWMLTGDRIDTAISVGLTSKLIDKDYLIVNSPPLDMKTVPPLVIDASALEMMLKSFPQLISSVFLKAPSVIISRCTPLQKETFIKEVGQSSGMETCAVGDGNNDIPMIRSASIGIGIVGKNGGNASISADCSISEFQDLQKLLFSKGSSFYRSGSKIIQFAMYKLSMIATIQVMFCLLYNAAPITVFNHMLTIGLAFSSTSAPIFVQIFDVSYSQSAIMNSPEVYKKWQREFSSKTLAVWILLAVFHGSVIIAVETGFHSFVGGDQRWQRTISFTAVILIELSMVMTDSTHLTFLSISSCFAPIIIYISCLFSLSSEFDIFYLASMEFWLRIAEIWIIAMSPVLAYKVIGIEMNESNDDRLTPEQRELMEL